MNFSRKQQQVLGLLCLIYGIWLLVFVASDTPNAIDVKPLDHPDPPNLPFYLDAPINVNRAGIDELQFLPGIGPVLAERIIAYRERHGSFQSPEALDNVHGIGPKTIQKVRHYLIFSD